MCNGEKNRHPQCWNGTDELNAMKRHSADAVHGTETTLKFKVRGKHYAIPLDDIIYLEKDCRRIHVHTMRGTISFYGRFIDVMPLLDERFTCCHKSYVLNMDEIRCLSQEAVIMTNDVEIRFGKRSYDRLQRSYLEWEKGQ